MKGLAISTLVFGDAQPGAREWDLLRTHEFSDIELAVRPRGVALDPGSVRDAIASASDANLRAAALSAPLDHALAALPALVDTECDLLVVRTGGCALDRPSERTTVPDVHALRHTLDQLAAEADRRGVTLAVEFPSTWTARATADFLESLDGTPLGVCLDLGHAHLRDGAADAIELLAGYVHLIHLNDNHGRQDEHRLPFAGSLDWPAVLMELEKTGYTGLAALEIGPDPDAASSVGRAVGARTRLQAILDDLAQPMVFPE